MKLKVFPFELHNFWYIVYFIIELLAKVNFFTFDMLAESAWSKHIICLSRHKLFHHDGILYQSWLAFTVSLLLSQRKSLHR